MDLSTVTIPGATTACISVSLMISILLPIALLIIWAVKAKSKITPALFGMLTFVVFALILERILHSVVISVMGETAFTSLAFYAIYGGLAAGLFEECGRYIVMRFIMKKKIDKKGSIMFGIGHGGIESIILIGATYAANLSIISMIQKGTTDMLFVGMDEAQKAELITQLSPLWTTPSASFLLGGLERVFAIFFHICASYLVYRAISASKPLFLVIAVLLHAVMDGLSVVLARLAGTAAAEIFLAVFTVIFVIVTVIMYRKEKEPLVEAAPQ